MHSVSVMKRNRIVKIFSWFLIAMLGPGAILVLANDRWFTHYICAVKK
jgi:hypothetical protein